MTMILCVYALCRALWWSVRITGQHECKEMQEHETIIRDVALQGTAMHHSGMPLDGRAEFLHCLCLQVQRA